MFSGLIEATGAIERAELIPKGRRLRVATALGGQLTPGESIAVNGVCLTATAADDRGFDAEVSPETARVSTLGDLASGVLVNLERPLQLDARLGGHFVLGHVDAVGEIVEVSAEAEFSRVSIRFPSRLSPLLVPKGSVAVDGISLTLASLNAERFDVQIVPYTLKHTNLQAARVGDAVNLECDIIGKYVVRAYAAGYGGGAETLGPDR